MTWVTWLKHAAEYLGGEQDFPPSGLPIPIGSPLWGLWWSFLTALIVLFCGQSSQFIYIDF